jgi:hypothetical protein
MEMWEPGWISRSSDCLGTASLADPSKKKFSLNIGVFYAPAAVSKIPHSGARRRAIIVVNLRRTLRALPLCPIGRGAAFTKDGERSNLLLRCPLGETNLLMGK